MFISPSAETPTSKSHKRLFSRPTWTQTFYQQAVTNHRELGYPPPHPLKMAPLGAEGLLNVPEISMLQFRIGYYTVNRASVFWPVFGPFMAL